MWHVAPGFYAERKLTKKQAKKLNAAFDGLRFSCRSPLENLNLDDRILLDIYV